MTSHVLPTYARAGIGFVRVPSKANEPEAVQAIRGVNGAEAVSLYKSLKPDLMLLDVNMPFKTGTDALGEVMKECPEARVVMLTSVADMDTVKRCVTLGAKGYIRKDTPPEQIKTLVANALGA